MHNKDNPPAAGAYPPTVIIIKATSRPTTKVLILTENEAVHQDRDPAVELCSGGVIDGPA